MLRNTVNKTGKWLSRYSLHQDIAKSVRLLHIDVWTGIHLSIGMRPWLTNVRNKNKMNRTEHVMDDIDNV